MCQNRKWVCEECESKSCELRGFSLCLPRVSSISGIFLLSWFSSPQTQEASDPRNLGRDCPRIRDASSVAMLTISGVTAPTDTTIF